MRHADKSLPAGIGPAAETRPPNPATAGPLLRGPIVSFCHGGKPT